MSDYTNTGLLFKNSDKTPDSKHPDYTGSLSITCEHCGTVIDRPLAGWIKVAKNAAKYLALSCRPKGARAQARRQADDMF